MLKKKKTTRKRNREWRKLFRRIAVFLIVFGLTLTSLLFIYNKDQKGILSPLSFAKNQARDKARVSDDVSIVKKALESKKIAFDDIKVSSVGAYVIKLRTGEDVILSSKKDLSKQLSSLQVIYSRLTMEGRGVRSLDFRYDKPVVVFK